MGLLQNKVISLADFHSEFSGSGIISKFSERVQKQLEAAQWRVKEERGENLKRLFEKKGAALI
ncbi:MAG TPA: hypothetical protein VMW67_04825 [Desulfobacteria bacterium]|nr:hypothetical protein [Desulfobacteria bacterium]